MKNKILKFTVSAFALLVGACITSCKDFNEEHGITIQGTPYEVYIVCDNDTWSSPAGDTIRTMLTDPVPAINQTEPVFDIVHILPGGLRNVIARHRNILKLSAAPSKKEAMVVEYDVSAHPQTVITVQAPSQTALANYLDSNREKLLGLLEKSERDRNISYARKYNEAGIQSKIKNRFGVDMLVPKGYQLRSEHEDFLWASYELPKASIGFFIYSYPYLGAEPPSPESIIDARNRFAALIPGPSEGSYMTTSPYYEPLTRHLRINGRLWVETRGLWDTANDFMGGPFVSFTTVDTDNKRVIVLDCYVMAVGQKKRNYIREAEHLVYLINVPESK